MGKRKNIAHFWGSVNKLYQAITIKANTVYFRFSLVWLNRLKNKLLANYLRSSGNELAIVRISAICDAMLSNNSFGDKDIIILWKSNKHNTNFIAPNHRELSLSIFAPLTWIRTDIHLKRLIAAISLFSLFTYVVFT